MQIRHKSLISKFSRESVGAVVGHAPHVWSGRLFISMPRGGDGNPMRMNLLAL